MTNPSQASKRKPSVLGRRRTLGQGRIIDLRNGRRVDVDLSSDLSDVALVLDDRSLIETQANCPELLSSVAMVRVVEHDESDVDAASLFGHVLSRRQLFAKRTIDIAVASLAGVIAAPVVAAAAIAIKLDSPGPVFFSQVRSGRDARPFTMYKLRTMKIDNDDSQHRAYVASLIKGEASTQSGNYKIARDSRVTRCGGFLRKYSIDELPQLWNVIRGDMSLTGPRPSLPHEVSLFNSVAWQRLRVSPGLTGLWQVSGRSRLTFDEMIDLDVKYWKQWSLLGELRIILKTPKAVLGGRGTA